MVFFCKGANEYLHYKVNTFVSSIDHLDTSPIQVLVISSMSDIPIYITYLFMYLGGQQVIVSE